MAWKLNSKGYSHARGLIEEGAVTDAEWSAPNLEDFKDIGEYALFHLAVDPDADPETAGAYGYPYGKNGKVYVRALRAIRSAAAGARGATPNKEIFDAAGRLLDMVNAESEKMAEKRLEQDNVAFKVSDEYKRVVTGPVLVPGEPDRDGDIVTREQVEDVAYKFMEDYQNIDLMHTFKNVAVPVESFILREPTVMGGMDLPAGTWILSAKIKDDKVWDGVLEGRYSAFSISAIKSVVKSDRADKRKTLSDLGENWEVAFVSIVDRPAVPKAQYVSMKSEPKMDSVENNNKGGDIMVDEKNDKEEVDYKGVLKSIFDTLKEHFSPSEPEKKETHEVKVKVEAPTHSGEDMAEEIKRLESTIEELKKELLDLKSVAGEDAYSDTDTPRSPAMQEAKMGDGHETMANPEDMEADEGETKEEVVSDAPTEILESATPPEEPPGVTADKKAKTKPEPKAKNGQVGVVEKSEASLNEEIGVDAFGRPLK